MAENWIQIAGCLIDISELRKRHRERMVQLEKSRIKQPPSGVKIMPHQNEEIAP
jgi:hypothetical protein